MTSGNTRNLVLSLLLWVDCFRCPKSPLHDQTTGTTETHDQNEDDTKDDGEQDDDDDTPLILSPLIGVSHDTLIPSATHLIPDTDERPLYSMRQEILAEHLF